MKGVHGCRVFYRVHGRRRFCADVIIWSCSYRTSKGKVEVAVTVAWPRVGVDVGVVADNDTYLGSVARLWGIRGGGTPPRPLSISRITTERARPGKHYYDIIGPRSSGNGFKRSYEVRVHPARVITRIAPQYLYLVIKGPITNGFSSRRLWRCGALLDSRAALGT